jgi:hypothetical protein
MPMVNAEMKSCIDNCLSCYQMCLSTVMGHCLEAGGQHTESKHFSLMIACAEICRTSAHFMLIGSELHKRTCRLCSEICEPCAADCDRIGEMKECADTCRRCAEVARKWLPERTRPPAPDGFLIMMRFIYKGPEPFDDGVPIPATLFRPFLQLCITAIGISLK